MEYIIGSYGATEDFLIDFLETFFDIQRLEAIEIGVCTGCKTILQFYWGRVFIDEIFLEDSVVVKHLAAESVYV